MYFNKLILLFIAIIGMQTKLQAQQLTQTIRGTVVDKVSSAPIKDVTVIILYSDPYRSVQTDAQGNFKFTSVAVGQQSLRFIISGYKDYVMQNLVVNSGKELVLNVGLEENIDKAVNVEIKAAKNKALNEMSVVSTRTFSVEETQKFAAAVNDPLRMAMAFPGVVQTGDGNNNISIRGNSPNGLLWRMEGVDIPNPNHYSNTGSSGGGISILSSQLLTNSDFSSGAFAAEYGNALSGVFDLRLRKGNNEKPEYTVQAGFLGIDVAAEGPIKKGYDGSYLVNYRYSTLSLLHYMGVNIGDGVLNFQDLAYNIYLPTKKYGAFSMFGFGGLSSQNTEGKKDTSLWTDAYYKQNSKFHANTGAAAFTHSLLINPKTYLKTVLAYSGTDNGFNFNEYDNHFVTHDQYSESYIQKKLTLSTMLNNKINARHSLRSGINISRLGYSTHVNQINDSTSVFEQLVNKKGNAYMIQAFSQWQYHISERLTSNVGLHYSRFLLNGSSSLEPRASIKYDLNSKQSISFGYGLHSQLQPIGIYFLQVAHPDGSVTTPNQALGFTKAHHYVVGYDINPTKYLHAKVEGYYQSLFDIPVSGNPANNFAMINFEGGTEASILQHLSNAGIGRNYGMEITLEHYTYRHFYLLTAISIYDSKYKGANGQWYNTRYNGNYALSMTTGKEIVFKKRTLGINIKTVYSGGLRDVPINEAASIAENKAVYDYNRSFEYQAPAYFRTDFKISLKRNYARATGTLALDIQNVTNNKNVYGRYYDTYTHTIKTSYQVPLLPILSYRLEF